MQNKQQASYRIRNWPEYTQSLQQRGKVLLWIDQRTIDEWQEHSQRGSSGRPRFYSDQAIKAALSIATVYHLALRQTQGFIQSIFDLMHVSLKIPNYSTLCRRRKTLHLERNLMPPPQEGMHIVIDSTGLKIFGEGEWKVRQHGYSKRRTWKKLHLGVDAKTQKIVAASLTRNSIDDGQMLPKIVGSSVPIAAVYADGAYDHQKCYEALKDLHCKVCIPPRHGARIWRHGNTHGTKHLRDENVRMIRKIGRKRWKSEVGYHLRSLAETAMYRIKKIFGDHLSSRHDRAQFVEAMIRCSILNQMTSLGMPQTVLTK